MPGEDAPPFAPTAPVLTGDLAGGVHLAAREAFAWATAEYGTAAAVLEAAVVSADGGVDTTGAGAGAGRGGGADMGAAVAVAAVLFRERFARLAATAAAAAAA